MASFLNRYIQRDKLMERDKKQVEQAKNNLIKRGISPSDAMKKIKKAFMGAIKEKTK